MAPIFVPSMNQQGNAHFLPLFRFIKTQSSICPGTDSELLRVTVISSRGPSETQTSELLKNVFHLDSLHRGDCQLATSADIGVGYLDALQTHCLVLHIVGDFGSLWTLVQEFTDYLLLEDSVEGVGLSRLQADTKTCGIDYVTIWTPSCGEDAAESFTDDAGFDYFRIQAPLGHKLFTFISDDVKDVIERKTKTHNRCLYQIDLPESRCADRPNLQVLFELPERIRRMEDFNQLRKHVLVLQESFCREANYEENIAENVNDEDLRKREQLKIKSEKLKRRKSISKSINHPLMQLFVHLLSSADPSIRILGLRQLEEELIEKSTESTRHLARQMDDTYASYIELLRDASEQNQSIERAKWRWIEAEKQFHKSVVGIEHLWREMGHLYVANVSSFHQLPQLAARHLVDGLCLELIDGDSDMINFPWIEAVLGQLQMLIGKSKKIFVLSVLGVQSSGKSTLLNVAH